MAQNIEPLTTAAEIVEAPATAPQDYEVGLKSLNQWQLAWRKFRKHKLALIGLAMMAALILTAFVGPILLPFNFTDIPKPDQIVGAGRPPSLQHPMGETGGLQRDVLTLVVNGSRTSLLDRLLEHDDRRRHRHDRRGDRRLRRQHHRTTS